MSKTPDEIKKGMECCTPVWKGNHWKTCDEECPYTAEMVNCRTMLNHDTLALIQQLEKDKKRARENAEILSAAVSRLEAERDAAVAALKGNCVCPECKYFSDDIQDPCRGCKPTDSKFEWRGVQKD